jgi:hypothetical protein
MDPAKRVLPQVTLENAYAAERSFPFSWANR